MTKLHRAIGAVDPSGDVSSGRVIMLGAWVMFIVVSVWILWNIQTENPAPVLTANGAVTQTWEAYSGFFKEFLSGLKWFLLPYLGGKAHDVLKKPTTTPLGS